MKKIFVLFAAMCLLMNTVLAMPAATDYSGNWELDKAKSTIPEQMRIDTMTMKVTQSDTELKVETTVKRLPPPEGAPAGGPPGGGPGGGGGRGPGGGGGGAPAGPTTYKLDGSETTVDSPGPGGMTIPVKYKAVVGSDGKLTLSSSRTFSGPNGDITTTTTETWELVDGGKGLKAHRKTESPRGTQEVDYYFAKKTDGPVRDGE